MPEGVPKNFPLKQAALMEFHLHRPKGFHSNQLGNMQGEQQYCEYYQGILELKDEWMSFFQHPENIVHCEHTCGLLRTLATIYRQRGTLEECEKVLDLEDQVLGFYEGHCQVHGDPEAVHCFEGLR